MASPSPGWYPDPHVPLLMRWWDGEQWSSDTYERTEPMDDWNRPAADATAAGSAPNPYASTVGTAAAPAAAIGVTPDGVLVAGWWPRAGARVLDGLITGVLSLLVAFPWTRTVVTAMADQVDAALRAAENGQDAVPFQYDAATLQAVLGLTLAWLAVTLVYELVFLLRWSATPGKLAAGLRVRPWAAEGRLRAGQVGRRWVAFEAASALSYVGLVYVVVDVLWPLRDRRRQALHDKLAGTCVVPRR